MYLSIYLVLAIRLADTARILGVCPIPSYSHFVLSNRIFKELARRGHDVTVISAYSNDAPMDNFREVLVTDALDKMKAVAKTFYDQSDSNIISKVMWMDKITVEMSEFGLNNSNVTKFLREHGHFDVVITHQLKTDSYYGFCHHFKAPCIALSPMSSITWISGSIGNPAPPSFVPQLVLGYTSVMNVWQRVHNTVIYAVVHLSYYLYSYPNHQDLLQKYFPGAPPLRELYYNISLVLFNGHMSIGDVAPLLPNAIDIAGYHVYPPKALPEDLRHFLDSARDGVIYFSMGSNLKGADFSKEKKDAVLTAFSKLNHTVLWKWENGTIPGQPKNVLVRPWFPQQDILAHPNVVLVVTHGGLLSTIESVYHGKPLLGLPVFADQGLNMAMAQEAGYGRYIQFQDLNVENFGSELREMLYNPSYGRVAKMRSKIMHDQPLSPLEKSMYWIEYVLRHKGAPHLKSSAMTLNWYQYLLWDGIFVGLGALLLVVVLIRMLSKVFWGLGDISMKKKRD
ncbi:UDP-glucuronosyltransferase 2C1-like [Photinus pyralis]|uniref:UDP-glucuronosyltransferase 2C1-like n=1 Tax=Photinus pyralis TaxID=7054 RepID=UPI001266FBBA|nr:UDP-glucuronosyltransferase 2C1-like [Photinus pyralis]